MTTLDDEQISVIKSAQLMLQMLSTTFPNPSTHDPIRGAAQNFGTLLQRARTAFPTIEALATIALPSSGDALPGLIAALSLLAGALPSLPSGERPAPGFL